MPERAPERPLSWLAPVPNGLRTDHDVLDDVFPNEHCAPIVALWFAHTHAAHRFYVTPAVDPGLPEPGSGKTRVLEVAALLVHSPESAISTTPVTLDAGAVPGPRRRNALSR